MLKITKDQFESIKSNFKSQLNTLRVNGKMNKQQLANLITYMLNNDFTLIEKLI